MKQFLNVRDVEQILEVSESKAYDIIRKLNEELQSMGYLTIAGKVSAAFFQKKLYGVSVDNREGEGA
ncbi:MAG: hypothetical protein HFE30_07205 [Clostridiales bacterium]|nr:hypothetical protein [Clostridiales bacterium]